MQSISLSLSGLAVTWAFLHLKRLQQTKTDLIDRLAVSLVN